MLKDLPSGDDFSVERALHDRMLAACRYHAKAGESHDIARYPNAFTAVGALVDGQAVCEGYARGMQYRMFAGDRHQREKRAAYVESGHHQRPQLPP